MHRIFLAAILALTLIVSSCGEKTVPMPENKILKEEFNVEYNSQDFSIYLKSFNKETLNQLVDAYVDKYKDKKLAMLKFKIYDTELPLELINKIDEPMKSDSLGKAIITFPPKGTKSVQCWYWFKSGDRDMSDIKEQK